MERYCLLVRADHELAGASSVSWADAAKEPLCLLTPDMQNRRIVDRAFRAANCAPVPRLETNSVINLCANVHLMGLASIIPEYFLEVMGPISDVRAVPLIEPAVEHSVGLVQWIETQCRRWYWRRSSAGGSPSQQPFRVACTGNTKPRSVDASSTASIASFAQSIGPPSVPRRSFPSWFHAGSSARCSSHNLHSLNLWSLER
jgi:LysR substrate binding domain-containing protein